INLLEFYACWVLNISNMKKDLDDKVMQDKAVSLMDAGFNCSQSVLSAYSEVLGFDNELALSVSCGFGAGMGRLQGTCGAVTGAYMVLGIYCSQKYPDNGARKAQSYLMIQTYNKQFIEKHKTTDCRMLLNCDLTTEQGQQFFQDNQLMDSVCKHCIRDSVQLVNEIIET
ncbi:MAG: C-GCAxxG-C-C family protein, partial [Bacteroidales bacterium]|nr:C-GCAxxG-C-C family protein [Bacteroidales bacterium]